MMRGLGSIDFAAAARSVLTVEQHPGNKDLAFLAQSKNNLTPKGRTLIFSKKEGQFSWQGVSRLDVEDLAGSGRGPSPRERLLACCWLEKRLESGIPYSSKDLELEAKDEDIAPKTLMSARAALGVKASKLPDGSWQCRLDPLPLVRLPYGIEGTK